MMVGVFNDALPFRISLILDEWISEMNSDMMSIESSTVIEPLVWRDDRGMDVLEELVGVPLLLFSVSCMLVLLGIVDCKGK